MLFGAVFSLTSWWYIEMQQRNSELPNETREYNEPWPDPNIPYNPEKIIADAEKHVKEKREAYLSSCLLNKSFLNCFIQ